MTYRCAGCEQGRCCLNSGTVTVMDQDGLNRYVCGCSCAARVRHRQDEDREISAFVRKYGPARLVEALNVFSAEPEYRNVGEHEWDPRELSRFCRTCGVIEPPPGCPSKRERRRVGPWEPAPEAEG